MGAVLDERLLTPVVGPGHTHVVAGALVSAGEDAFLRMFVDGQHVGDVVPDEGSPFGGLPFDELCELMDLWLVAVPLERVTPWGVPAGEGVDVVGGRRVGSAVVQHPRV